MRVAFSRRAQDDQDAIIAHLGQRSPSGARKVAAAFERALATIGDHPLAGAGTRRRDVKSVVLGRFPYRIFYHVGPHRVLVLHIRHTSRRPWTGT